MVLQHLLSPRRQVRQARNQFLVSGFWMLVPFKPSLFLPIRGHPCDPWFHSSEIFDQDLPLHVLPQNLAIHVSFSITNFVEPRWGSFFFAIQTQWRIAMLMEIPPTHGTV